MSIGTAGLIASFFSYVLLIIPESSVEMIDVERFWDIIKFMFLPMTLTLLLMYRIKSKREAPPCVSLN